MNTKQDPIEVQLEALKSECETCNSCELGKTRINTVFSDGNCNAKIMIIGEAPGKNEDETGLAFVGRAGKLLDKVLLTQNLTRKKDVYICNTVKCRPPQNRVPKPCEKAACRPFLDKQIKIIQPQIILLAGATAVKSMLETKLPISKIRGQWFEGPHESRFMPVFHPSYLLRHEYNKAEGSPYWLMLNDLQTVRDAYTT